MGIRILILKFTEMNVHISKQTGHTALILTNEIFSCKTCDVPVFVCPILWPLL